MSGFNEDDPSRVEVFDLDEMEDRDERRTVRTVLCVFFTILGILLIV